MTIEIAGAADIITGAIIGRAIEPEAGEGKSAAVGNCLNCDTVLAGPHCHGCGQKGKAHRTLAAFGHDILHSVLHFDGKIWRTLPLLFWYPGELTRRYVEGERAKFVSPIALFLFTVFLSFAVFSALIPADLEFKEENVTAAEAAESLKKDRKDITEKIAELEGKKKAAIAKGSTFEWMDDAIVRHRESLIELDNEKLPEIRQREIAERKLVLAKQNLTDDIARLESELSEAKSASKPTAKLAEDLTSQRQALVLMNTAGAVFGKDGANSDNVKFDLLGNKTLEDMAKHAAENPKLLIYKIQSNAYKYSWALIPISIPFVWILFFWKRRFKLFDHAVFITYSMSLMLLFSMASGVILGFADSGSAVFVITICALIIFPLVHMYRQIRGAYQTSRFGALWRTFVLSNFTVITLSIFALLIFSLGIVG
jgi:Protein of unknown function (DUF3667)